jgi:hypothetical protein
MAFKDSDYNKYADPRFFDFKFQINNQLDVCVNFVLKNKPPQAHRYEINPWKGFKNLEIFNLEEFENCDDFVTSLKGGISATSEKITGDIVYYQRGSFNTKKQKLPKKKNVFDKLQSCFQEEKNMDEFLMLTHSFPDFLHGNDGFAFNNKNIYFWNLFEIWYFDITLMEEQMTQMVLYVSPNEAETTVK